MAAYLNMFRRLLTGPGSRGKGVSLFAEREIVDPQKLDAARQHLNNQKATESKCLGLLAQLERHILSDNHGEFQRVFTEFKELAYFMPAMRGRFIDCYRNYLPMGDSEALMATIKHDPENFKLLRVSPNTFRKLVSAYKERAKFRSLDAANVVPFIAQG